MGGFGIDWHISFVFLNFASLYIRNGFKQLLFTFN